MSGQVAFLDEKLAANEKNNELLAAENATLQRENEGLRKKLAELGALILQLTQTS